MTLKTLLRDREKGKEFFRKNRWIFLIGIIGIVLLLLPTERQETKPVIEAGAEEVFSLDAFEAQLEAILSDIQGAGHVHVMLALKNGTETVYATNDNISLRTSGDETVQSSDRTVVTRTQTGEAVEEKQIYPCFSGAIVVSSGANKASVELMLIRAVAAITGLSTDKISVLPGK